MAHDASVDGHILTRHSDIAALDTAVPNKSHRNKLRGIGSDSEADTLSTHDGCGIDSNHFAARTHKRSTRITRVERCVGLNHVVDQTASTRTHAAAKRAYYSRGDRVLKS